MLVKKLINVFENIKRVL